VHTDISVSIDCDTEELEHSEFDTVKAYTTYSQNNKRSIQLHNDLNISVI